MSAQWLAKERVTYRAADQRAPPRHRYQAARGCAPIHPCAANRTSRRVRRGAQQIPLGSSFGLWPPIALARTCRVLVDMCRDVGRGPAGRPPKVANHIKAAQHQHESRNHQPGQPRERPVRRIEQPPAGRHQKQGIDRERDQEQSPISVEDRPDHRSSRGRGGAASTIVLLGLDGASASSGVKAIRQQSIVWVTADLHTLGS